jgi:hypothetical protein
MGEAPTGRCAVTGLPAFQPGTPGWELFAEIRLGAMQHIAAHKGETVDAAEARKIQEAYANRDPACWSWPAPETCTFADDESAAAFLNWWNHDCAVCGAAGTGGLVEDHDHRTGLVRGRLCRSCNAQEGRSDAGVFQKYRERSPAAILGISVRYHRAWTGDAVDRMHTPVPAPLAEDL